MNKISCVQVNKFHYFFYRKAALEVCKVDQFTVHDFLFLSMLKLKGELN